MIYFLVFIEGYIGLAYQMLFIRQLTPEVGASAVTSSWVIGFFLLALAIGYRTGGKPCAHPLRQLGFNLLRVGALGGIALSSFSVSLFFEIFKGVPTLVPLILYSLLFVAPIAYFMGQSLPLLIQRSKWGEATSEISGNALYLSTIGSFVGAIATTNIFFFFIGATYTLVFVSILTLAVAGYLLIERSRRLALFFSILGVLLNVGYLYKTKMHSTPYSDVHIVKLEDGSTQFVANGAIMSGLSADHQNTSWYLAVFNKFLVQNNIQNKDILMLGAGGFVSHLADKGANRYMYIDIDPDLKNISEKEFLKEEVGHNFVAQDARRYLIDTDKKYDLIFLDAFSGKSIPSHLLTEGFFELLKLRIAKNGYFIMNTVMSPFFSTNYSRRTHATVTSVFPFCRRLDNRDQHRGYLRSNVVYICPKYMEGVQRYTDDKNTSEFDYFNVLKDRKGSQ